jgi:3-methyladenine DNA glycosylase AlkC
MKEKLEALKVKYQKKEMQRIADDLKKYIYKQERR